MRKKIIVAFAVGIVISIECFSQKKDSIELNNFILKTDIFLPALFAFSDIHEGSLTFEKGFKNRHSIQLTGMATFLNRDESEPPYTTQTWKYDLYETSLDYKFYLFQRKKYTGFYIGVFAKELIIHETSSIKYAIGGDYYFEYRQYVGGLGPLIGYQNYFKKRWVIDFLLGVGELFPQKVNVIKNVGFSGYQYEFSPKDLTGRIGLNVGYRF